MIYQVFETQNKMYQEIMQCIAPDKTHLQPKNADIFFYFSMNIYVVGTH